MRIRLTSRFVGNQGNYLSFVVSPRMTGKTRKRQIPTSGGRSLEHKDQTRNRHLPGDDCSHSTKIPELWKFLTVTCNDVTRGCSLDERGGRRRLTCFHITPWLRNTPPP